MPTPITPVPTLSAVSGPAAGDTVSAAALITNALQGLANRDEYLRQPLEVSGIKKVQGLTLAAMAGPAPTPALGLEGIVAYSYETSSIWVYDSAAVDVAAYGVCIAPSSGGGRWLNTSALLIPGQRFRAVQRVNVNIPLSSMVQRASLGSGASQLDGINYSVVHTGLLAGVQKLDTNAFANFTFRARLPKGRLVGVSLVMVPNGSGSAAPGSTSTTLSQPLRVTVKTVKGSQDSFTAPGIHNYDTTTGFTTSVATVWTGTCGVAGNALNSSVVWSEQTPKLFNFAESTTSTNSATTGGTAGLIVSENREYIFNVADATFAGADYTSLWPDGLQPIVYRLEAWIDVTEPGVG